MSVISSLGVGSGLDLNSLVKQLVTAERQPQENRLNRREADIQAQLSAFGTLKSNLSTLNTALSRMALLNEGRSGSSSDPTRVTARIDSTAAIGEYRIAVNQLASAESRASGSFTNVANIGTGTFSLKVGNGPEINITIDTVGAGKNDLFGIRNAINESGADVRASIVTDDTGSRLVLESKKTGEANTIAFNVVSGFDGVAQFSTINEDTFTSGTGGRVTEAQNAKFTINGLALESSSNQLGNTLQGVSLNLLATTAENSPILVTVGRDRETLTKTLNEFVEAYNNVMRQTKDLGRYNPDTQEAGVLQGDPTLRSIQSRLASSFQQTQGLNSQGLNSLMNIGINSDRNGELSINSTTLDRVLDGDFGGVLTLIKDISTQMRSELQGFSQFGGILDARRDGLNSRLTDVNRQRELLVTRMERYETLLTRQFGAMDSIVGQLQNTSAYLAQQFDALNNNKRR